MKIILAISLLANVILVSICHYVENEWLDESKRLRREILKLKMKICEMEEQGRNDSSVNRKDEYNDNNDTGN